MKGEKKPHFQFNLGSYLELHVVIFSFFLFYVWLFLFLFQRVMSIASIFFFFCLSVRSFQAFLGESILDASC